MANTNFSLHLTVSSPMLDAQSILIKFQGLFCRWTNYYYYLSVVRVSQADKKEFGGIFFPSQTISEVWHFRESWLSPWEGEEHTLAESYCVPATILALMKYISHGSWMLGKQNSKCQHGKQLAERCSFCMEGMLVPGWQQGKEAKQP